MTYTDLDVHDNDAALPRINMFTKELCNWLILMSICMFLIYAILYIVYEVALDLAHVRWAFTGFLICCLIDTVSFWICRYAVSDQHGTEKFLVWLVLILQITTGLFYLIAPIAVLYTYRFSPEVSMQLGENILPDDKEKLAHTLEDYVDPDPCRDQETDKTRRSKEPLWQCGYVRSIRTASFCMWISVLPKILICYLLLRILKKNSR